jgi:hypothetical protein
MARRNLKYFVFDVAVECNIRNRSGFRIFQELGGIKLEFFATMTEGEDSSVVGKWEDKNERPEHVLRTRRINVSLEE